MIGVQSYNKRYLNDDYSLGIAHFALYMGLWLVLEIIHQVRKRRLVPYRYEDRVITTHDF